MKSNAVIKANELLVFDHYNVIYKCRSNNGRGVAFLIRNCHFFNEIDLRNCFNSISTEEVIGFSIILNKTTHSFFTYYNPPNRKLNYALFESIQKTFNNYINMGDFNVKTTLNGCDKNNANGIILQSILFNLEGLILNIKQDPTFHIYNSYGREDYHSMIDLFYGSALYASKIITYRVIKSALLDSIQAVQYHSAIEIKFNLQNNTNSSENTTSQQPNRRQIEKADWKSFTKDLNSASKIIFNSTNYFPSHELIHIELNKAIEKNIPISKGKITATNPLPNYILKDIAMRNKLRRYYINDRSEENKNKLYKKIEEVHGKILAFNSQKWSTFLMKIGPNPLSTKAYWRRINRIRSKKSTNKISNLIVNEKYIDTDEGKA